MLIGVNAFIAATGVIPGFLLGDDIIDRPLEAGEMIHVGVITRKDYRLTRFA
jgi:hypothetical protein